MASDRRPPADPCESLDGEVVDCGPASMWPGPRASPSGPAGAPAAGPRPTRAGYMRPAAGVRLAAAAGEVVALDLRRDRYYGLGPEASRVVHEFVATPRPAQDGMLAALEPALRAGLVVPVDRKPAAFRIPGPREPGGVRTRSLLSDTDDDPP